MMFLTPLTSQYNPIDEKSVSSYRQQMRMHKTKGRLSLMFSTSRVTIMLSLLLCMSGMMWQLYAVCVDYFAYSVVSDVSLIKVYEIEPPAFSLCLPYVDIVDWQSLGLDMESINASFVQSEDNDWRTAVSQWMQENIPVTQIFSATPDLERLITRSWIRQEDSYTVLTGVSNLRIRKFLRDDCICYRVTHRQQTPDAPPFYLKSHHVAFGKRTGGLLGLRLKKDSVLKEVSRAIVFLHPIDMFPRGDRDYGLFLSSESRVFDDETTFWTISWSRTLQVLLPPPFVTNCRNNQELGFENKEHCQHDCVSNYTMRLLGKTVFTRTLTDLKSNETVLSSESLIQNRSLEQQVDRLVSQCNDSCWGHNCLRVNYMPIVTSALDGRQNVVFQVYDMNTLETRIGFQAKLSFVSFLVYILSITGFWFGVSCLDLVTHACRSASHWKRLKHSIAGRDDLMRRQAKRPVFDPTSLVVREAIRRMNHRQRWHLDQRLIH